MNPPQGLQCPRCSSAVSENSEYCETCRFRFRLSASSLHQAASHGDAIYRQSATRQLERIQSPISLQIWAFIVALLAIFCLVSGFSALLLDTEEPVCLPPRGKICALAYMFGGTQHLNLTYGIILLVFSLGFTVIAWKLYRSSLDKIAAALAREASKK